MDLAFVPITLDRQDAYLARLRAMPALSSDYSFVNLWSWSEAHGLSWAWEANLVWIKQSLPYECYWAPVGDWAAVDWERVMPRWAGLPFARLPEPLALGMLNAHPRSRLKPCREHWDYLYSVPDLIALSGNRYHPKMNLLHQFKNSYLWRYLPLTDELIGMVLEMQDQWCAWRNCEESPGLAAEDQAIAKVLGAYSSLRGLLGGVLMIDAKVAAFTVAEALTDDTLVIHFEKGMADYKGIYQAINHEFLAANSRYALVNREQDLGDEGLRKAKMSYHPVSFLRKYELLWQ